MSVNLTLEGPVSFNLDEVHDVPVSTGWHQVTVEQTEAKLSKKDHPQIFFLSRISDEADEDFNRTIIWNLTFDGNMGGFNMKRVRRFCEAAGIPLTLDYASYEAMAEDMINREVMVEVKHQEYEGETQARVNKWQSVSFDDIEL